MTEIQAKPIFDTVTFWRSCTLLMISFLVGNGTSYLAFGLHTATKADVEKSDQAQSDRSSALEARMLKMEEALNYLAGTVHQKGLDTATDPK